MTKQPSAPNMRSFSLNSRDFYQAVTAPPDPWVWAGGLPREPKAREREVIVEVGSGPKQRRS